MKNKYGLPENELSKIRERDRRCVYCHKIMVNPKEDKKRNNWATIEHLNYIPPWNNISTVAICCGSCNSSRGMKKITDWFKREYCIERNINHETVSKPVKDYIRKYEK